jgi:hypothetical protein
VSRQRGKITRLLVGLAVAIASCIAIGALTSGITPTTQADCLHRTDCTSEDPPVYCTNNHYYANVCVAQAACQYKCCVPGVDPDCGDPS